MKRAVENHRRYEDHLLYENIQKPFSEVHLVTVSITDGVLTVRQLNNEVHISDKQKINLLQLFSELKNVRLFNIKIKSLDKFTASSLNKDDLILNPVQFIFISSYGLLGDSEWTSNVPSEGMWVISEWLLAKSQEATTLCIDPNMFSSPTELLTKISEFIIPGSQVVFGFSMLPVNLRNDISLFELIHKIFPNSRKIVGGIGSDSLQYLPTMSGRKGLDEVLPVDLIIPGYAVKELEVLAKYLHNNTDVSRNSIRQFAHKHFPDLYTNENWESILERIIQSRKTAKDQFIPQGHLDLIHPQMYSSANSVSVDGVATGSIQVLSDNSCSQKCSYCAVPKNLVFNSREQELAYLLDIGKHADVISFNNNDLANDPEKMIWLCGQMVKNGLIQPKHGKMRITSFNQELIDALFKANFVRIACGVESFDSTVRSGLSKNNFSDANINESLSYMLEVGITPEINLMLFNQFETDQSLRLTTEKSLYWLSRGAIIYATFGVFATPNSPSVLTLMKNNRLEAIKNKIILDEISFSGSDNTLLYPTQWKASPLITNIKENVAKKRKNIIDKLQKKYSKKINISVEAYIAIVLLAQYFEITGYKTDQQIYKKIEAYLQRMLVYEYISI
ncbi:MAG: hypothetical protein H6772_00710 [Pseudomonadales bacterium]|nr:hypothetical protein [Pseudomonadales bacterium]